MPNRPPERPEVNVQDPGLISRVNAAATRFPVLSGIIHRAAKGTADKGELWILGRVVAKVKNGGVITEEDLNPPVPLEGKKDEGKGRAKEVAGALGPGKKDGLTLAPAKLVTETVEDGAKKGNEAGDGQQDQEGDEDGPYGEIKGSPQVGGGPLPGNGPVDVDAKATGSGSADVPTDAARAAPLPSRPPVSTTPGAPPIRPQPLENLSFQTPFPVRPIKSKYPAMSYERPLYSPAPTSPYYRPPAANVPHYRPIASNPPNTPISPGPASASPRVDASPSPAPEPKAWPAIPRFILFAFKETPTDKMLLPLGMNSFISRIGGDHVTAPGAAKFEPQPVELMPATPAGKTRSAKGSAPEPVVPVPVEIKHKNAGRVLISTFAGDWEDIDWDGIQKQLPWNPGPVPNVAAMELLSEGAVQPVTMRLDGLDDAAWTKMKAVVKEVEIADMAAKQLDEEGYKARKKDHFAQLVKLVPERTFLQTRTRTVDPALVEAMTDRWALRPYPLSTRPLYDPGVTDEWVEYEPIQNVKKRKVDEPAVEFEMPVSLDALDEMVEEGAKVGIGRAGRAPAKPKREPKYRKRPARTDVRCEGCGLMGKKVWRRGPGGPGTRECCCNRSYRAHAA